MTPVTVINIVIPLLAGISIVLALFFTLRALQQRSELARAAYSVGRQEARQAMQVDVVRGIAAFLVGLILLGVFGLSPRPVESALPPTDVPSVTEPAGATPETAAPTATVEIVPTNTPTVEPSPTVPPATPTETPIPTDTPAPEPRTATVSSGVGVWLRAAPGTNAEQLEWVQDGTVLTLLDGYETADDLEWQRVQTPAGSAGWVAVPFIVYDEP
ncbi:MAG TPA: SH3 domain-containing protein [Anaerolineae bacterium]